jgi:hypothetical protein
MTEFQKDSEDVSAGIGIFYYPIIINFVGNMMRSKLTSPGTIRV